MLSCSLVAADILPVDGTVGALAGRIWRPAYSGPSVVAIRPDGVYDVSSVFPTMRDLCEADNPAEALKSVTGERVCSVQELLDNTPPDTRREDRPHLLAPLDIQAIKAAGVTFATSMLERVIEERARGNPEAAASIRTQIVQLVGNDLHNLKPGSEAAREIKKLLIAQGAWSQYLEVGIGPDAEIFSKAQPMSAVGAGFDAGILPSSTWNNPEPEIVVYVNSRGGIVGAALGNDVNLRDVEGRSALLLSKAKDNNASCAIGPFVRFFDGSFSLDDLRTLDITLDVRGEDGYQLHDVSSLKEISRDVTDLVSQTINIHHRYPDGLVLFLGTLFAPIADRGVPDQGFTHKVGDIVEIKTSKLGVLTNRIRPTHECAQWTFGTSHLMRNLAIRGLLSN